MWETIEFHKPMRNPPGFHGEHIIPRAFNFGKVPPPQEIAGPNLRPY